VKTTLLEVRGWSVALGGVLLLATPAAARAELATPIGVAVPVGRPAGKILPVAAVQEAPPQGQAATAARELTLEEALALAKKANHSLAAERQHFAQAETNLEQAWSVLFPTVATQGKYTHNYRQYDLSFGMGMPPITILKQEQLDASVNLTLPLLVPAAYPALKAVEASVAASKASYDSNETQILFAVAQAFYGCAAAEEVLLARRSSIDVARATLSNAETRFAAGTVTKVDVDRAQLAVLRAEQQEREASEARRQAYRALATLTGMQGEVKVRPAAPSVPAATPITPGSLADTLQLRPEFRAVELTNKSAALQADAYAWRWAPSLSAFGTAHVGNYKGFTGDRYSWAVGAQLDWVLFDGGARDAQRHLAAAQAREAAARAEVLQDSIRDELANTRGQLDTKRSAQETADRQVALSQETVSLIRTQYEAGTATQIDLLQAQDNLVASQETLAQSHFDVAVTELALRRAEGRFPAPELAKAP